MLHSENNTATKRLTTQTTTTASKLTSTKTTTGRRTTASPVLPNRMATSCCRKNRCKNNRNQFSRTPEAAPSAAERSTNSTTTTEDANRCNAFKHRVFLVAAVFLVLASDVHLGASAKLIVHADEFQFANTTSLDETAATTTATEPASWHNATKWQTPKETFIEDEEINNTSTAWSSSSAETTTPATFESWRQPSFFGQYAKRRFISGNELWDGIISDCYQRPSFSCFQKNVYVYLSDALETNDVNVTQRLKFFRNHVIYDEKPSRGGVAVTEAAVPQDDDGDQRAQEDGNGAGDDDDDAEQRMEDEHLMKNEIPQQSRSAPQTTPIEEVTNALYGKSVKFAMTHDVELQLPEILFDGATFRISPRSFEGDGVIAKLELIPKQAVEARLAGKILMKKIQKFLRSKLLLSFLALVLIIKIIKIKLFWLLPVIIGVGAAKKLLLKFLLFLFPALSHLFKLCSYYQQTYHSTKYHHHHHLINHHHTVVPPWHSSEHHSVPEIIYSSPPKGHPSAYLHEGSSYPGPISSSHEHYDDGWVSSGPGLGSEYISDINRVAQIDENSNFFKPHTANDANELNTWGLGPTQATVKHSPTAQQQRPPILNKQQHHHASSHSFNPFINPDKQSLFNIKQQKQSSKPSPVYTPPRSAVPNVLSGPPSVAALNAAQIAAQYDPSRNNLPPSQQQQQEHSHASPVISAQLQEAIRIQAEQRIVAQQQKILENQPFAQDGQPIMPKNYDPFYSPILLKIDKILELLGVQDDLCKERLVCSMYKDPNRYSPHSNFVSAQLSRDTNELQPVANTNGAVTRFYRLIQAARDGQEQKDCLRIYTQCSINTA